MLNNELLLRSELGKPKRRGYNIEHSGYDAFGRPNEKGCSGASEALGGWGTTEISTLPFHRKEKPSERDFIELNKIAVSSGIVNSGENYAYRATNDVRRKPAGTQSKPRPRRQPPSMVYGISTRPSTPIFDLLEHKYQDKWLQQREQDELAKKKENTKKRHSGVVYETRASLLRTYQNPVESGPLWQLPKFKNSAKPNLQTFRTKNQEGEAFDNFKSDKIARKGDLGHGVYESAKN
ncbi:hypothetical protein LOTGIDRAFT_126939 [Lottia gigantea]|uniref:Cilia- and flagella-associated protein 77 n=1 Tax=Lottia gigantea TaxID=225164 RepID=V4A441_LOTGI|nr:hypothetical protein LOTGIDRAFT_126939 [Lottia gigantea]ESO88011.1 hypothetical protein LOTGIDRAFT_126939 [Lottia gigantea]